MFSTRTKVLLVQVMFLVLFLAFVIFTISKSISELYQTQEKINALESMTRVKLSIQRELDELRRTAWDYATWDDAYRYMETKDQAFIDEHLDDAAFKEFRIHAAFFFDCGGSLVWGKALKPKTYKTLIMLDFVVSVKNSLNSSLVCPNDLIDGKPYKGPTGVYATSRGPVMLAWQPVVTSLYRGPPRGTLLMARFITKDVIAEIARQTRVQFKGASVHALSDPQKDQAARLAETGVEMSVDSNNLLHVHGVLEDVRGEPALLLELLLPRPLVATGVVSQRAMIASVMTAGAVLILLTFITVRRMVSAPMNRIIHVLEEIATKEDLDKRLPEMEKDEFVKLRKAINNLLERLSR